MIKMERLGVRVLEKNLNNDEEEYITIDLGTNNENIGKRTSRSTKNKKTRIGSKKEGKIKWSKKKIAITVAIILAIIIILIGISFGRYVYKAEGDVKKAVLNMASDVAVNIVGRDEPIFVLVLGISEDITSKLTDTIILGGYNPESQKAFMVSIPRDTFVGTNEATASGWDKINALYQKDITKTIKAVEERTGINIDNYVVVRNTMLPALVNAIGEVEFDVPIDMDYDDPTQDLHIHLKAGPQMINGDEAEQLLRFRHNNDGSSYPSSYGDNDYGRMRTQREFIKVVANHLIKVNDMGKLKAIAEALFSNLETNMSIGDIIGYIPHAINFNIDDVRMEQLPGSGAMLNKLSFYKASYARSKTLMNDLIKYLELDEKETKKYYTGKIKQTVAATSEAEKEDVCEHKYSSEIIKESTCKEVGTRKYTCSLCKSSYEEEIAKSNHDYNSNGICTLCNSPKPTNNHEHNYVVLDYVILDATCISDGSAVYKCDSCTLTLNKTIKATGKHTYGANGKCTTTGCTAKKEEPTPTDKENNGEQSGETTKPVEKPQEHTHSYTETVISAPTCTTPGTTKKECSCGVSENVTIPAKGHSYTETVISAPTCTTPGTTKKDCACGASESITTAAKGHSYANGVCTTCGTPELVVIPPNTDSTTVGKDQNPPA